MRSADSPCARDTPSRERLLDARVGRLLRIAGAEVDHFDAALASRSAAACARRTNGYVVWSRRTGERGTGERYPAAYVRAARRAARGRARDPSAADNDLTRAPADETAPTERCRLRSLSAGGSTAIPSASEQRADRSSASELGCETTVSPIEVSATRCLRLNGEERAQRPERPARAPRSRLARRARGRSACAPGPRLTASMPRSVKSATFVHACFGSTSRPPAARSLRRAASRRPTGGRRRVARQPTSAPAGTQRRRYASASSGVRSGGVAEVEVRVARSGTTLSAMPALQPCHRDHLVEREARRHRLAPLERGERRAGPRRRARSRCRRATAGRRGRYAAEDQRARSGCRRSPPGSRRRSARAGLPATASQEQREAVEERGQRVRLLRQLLALEDEQRDVVAPAAVAPRPARGRARARTATPPFMSLAPRP